MTDYEMLKKAFTIMEDCFKEDVDKAGTPYIYHPVMVALQCNTTEEKVVGLLHDVLEDHPEKVTIEMLKEELSQVLLTLTEREEKVLRLRFGLDDGQCRTLEEVGQEFNVTRERIRQIEAKALRKLRHPSRSNKLKDFVK